MLSAALAVAVLPAAGDFVPQPAVRPHLEQGTEGAACAVQLAQARTSIRALVSRGHAQVLRDINGEAAKTWIATLNAFPPETVYAGDTVVVIIGAWSRDVLFGIYRNGCEVTSGSLSPLAFQAIDRAAIAALGEST